MENTLAFHGKAKTKAHYVARVRAHAAADEIIHGQYWEGGKGCAVGCTIHSSDHSAYTRELGIPESLARLEDHIFEQLENGESKKFPLQFLTEIKVGADLSRVTPKFLLALQRRNIKRLDKEKNKKQIEAINQVIKVLLGWSKTGKVDESARSAAESAAESAWSAAESASESARSAARSAAESAAESAAWSAAESAARSAAESAAWSAGESEYLWMKKTLLKLLREAK